MKYKIFGLQRPRTRRRAAVGAVLLVSIVGAFAALRSTSAVEESAPVETASAVPVAAVDRGLVFAHYFPPYPISIDNRDPTSDFYATDYLNRGGADAAFGGLLRDRPTPRDPLDDPEWRLADLETEVRQAASAGIDGFSVDILTPRDSAEWIGPVPALLMQAAAEVDPDFKVMLMPDMDGAIGSLDPTSLAAELAVLAANPSAYRLADGRLVVSPYKAENRPAAWWSTFLDVMRADHGIDVAFVPVFQDMAAYTPEFGSISFGVSAWGGRNPAFNPVGGFPLDEIREIHASGKLWMQPVSVQDYRPAHQIFDEAENTTNLRNTWQIAIDSGSEWVQIATWNDYAEHTAIAPSVNHGTAFLDICAYYIEYFKSGEPPTIDGDRVFLTHRTQLLGAVPTGRQTELAMLRPGSSPGRNEVEALTFLTAPAEVELLVGATTTTCDAPAGVSTCTAPIPTGGPATMSVRAVISRDGGTVAEAVSPFPILAAPVVEDLQYTASESE